MNKHLRRFIFAGGLFVVVLLVGLFLEPGQSSALITNLTQRLNGDVSIGCPSGCQAVTDNPTSYYQIESPKTGVPTNVRITVSYPCSSSMGFTLNALVGGGDPNYQDPSACASRSGGSAVVNFNMYTGANCKLDTDTSECIAIISITAIGASSGHFAYKLDVNGNVDIANAASTDPTGDPAPSPGNTNWPTPPSWARQFGLFPQNPTFSFTTPCNMTKQFIYLGWSGVDYGSSYQPNGVSWQLTDNGVWYGSRSNGQLDGNNPSDSTGVFSYGFWAYPNHTYQWSWSGIDQGHGGNEVVFSVPFTQNSFDIGQNCNSSTSWQLSGKSTVSIPTVYPGGSVSFYHTVTNAPPPTSTGAATYSWQVQSSYGDTSGSYADNGLPGDTTTGPVPPGSSWPNPSGNSLVPWPTTATNFGAIYCQRIIYTNANGLNDPPNGQHTVDTRACVQLAKPTTPVLTCNSTYVPAPKSTDPAFVVPSGSGWSTNTSLYKVGYADITVAGTNADPSNFKSGTTYANESSASDATDHEPYTVSYKPTGNTISITITYYEYAVRHDRDKDGNLVYQKAQIKTDTTNLTCYDATCTLSISGGLGPNKEIVAGQDIDVSGTIVNPSPPPHPEKIPLDPSLPNGNRLSLTFNGGEHDWNSPVLVGGSSGSIDLGTIKARAGPDPGTQTITAYPDYYKTGQIGSTGCSVTFDVYAPFTLTPHAQVILFNSKTNSVSTENPDQVVNNTWVTISGPKVSENTTSKLYEVTAGGATIAKASTANPGPFDPAVNPTTCLYQGAAPNNVTGCNPPYDGTNFTYAPSALEAGDTYCAEMTIPNGIDPTDSTNIPYVGPGGDVVGGAQVTATNCPVVTNRPYLKVYNSGISAGGYSPTSSGFCNLTANGNIGSWNDNSGAYPPLTNFGAGTPLSALASGQIVGFASGQTPASQTAYSRSPTDLAFANQGPGVNTTGSSIEGRSYSPYLGGNYGGNTRCLPDVAPPSGVTPTAGPVMIPATNVTGSTSTFVNGDVYITGDITYQGSGGGWNITDNSSNVPSFVVHATGNIYISPGVKELDGLYVSQGKIYTCVPTGVSAPLPAAYTNSIYNNGCNQQLTVYGSFIADQVVMQRTFGSLRDETPTPGATGGSGATTPLVWSCGGGICNPPGLGVDSCVHINETAEPAAHAWGDNQLCVAGADAGGTVKLAWTHGADTSFTPANDGGDHSIDSQSYLQSNGYPDCTSWGSVNNAPYNYPAGYTWSNNVLCSNVPVHFYAGSHAASSGEYCTAVTEPSDTDGNNVWNSSTICIDKASPPSPSTPATALTCSNDGGRSSPRPTCAAEVFDFSPGLYLSTPAVKPPSNGALQVDAITSLPPVL